MQIHRASTADDIIAIRSLFQEYAAWLKVDLCFQRFSEELASLPGAYALPEGRLLLATITSSPAGCVALRPLDLVPGSACELKRLYVRPAYRHHGLGRALTQRLISEARKMGYSRMLLDTLPSMNPAICLYQSLGFVSCPKYYDTPLTETVFMELKLT